jgi:aminopeptidase N
MATGTEAEAAARAALLEVDSYQVFLDLAADPGAVLSRTQIRFRCREPGASTFADLSADAVRRVELNGASLDPAAELAGGRLRLAGLAAANVLTVDAVFGYASDGQGMSRFTDPADGAGYVLATCFPTQAGRVFCCFDQPDLHADLTLTVAAPAGWDCVGNGTVIERPAAGQAGVWRFAAVTAMKPYEFTLIAGPYLTTAEEDHQGSAGSIRLSVRCRPALAGSAGLRRIGTVVRQALAYYERLLQVACPYPKYDIVFTPELGPLAMQLPAVMAVSESLLQRAAEAGGESDHGDDSGPGDDFVAVVLAHEVAHLWFGCLVEGRWWNDLWLAEAMATYLSYTAAEHELGLDSAWAQFCMQGQADAYRTDSLPGTQPISAPVADADDALAGPPAITYSKGASVIRQLAALIGDDALRNGLRDYLTRFAGTGTTLADLIGCCSAASGRDLTGWAEQWLRTPGVNLLRPELTLAADDSVQSLAVIQEPPPAAVTGPANLPGDRSPGLGVLRTHRVAIGLYQRDGGRLARRGLVSAELAGARGVLAELAGTPAPDAVIVNDGSLTFARIRFDSRSWRALAACALDVGDPLTEAVCWNAAWDMTTAAELAVSEFTDLVARRISSAPLPAGLPELLARAVTGADYYAAAGDRPGLRERLAAAALQAAGLARPGSRAQRELAAGFAASAHGQDQLELLRSWLDGRSLPGGLTVQLSLRGQILATLAAGGKASDDDLDALAADDPVSGRAQRATCRALRPDPAAKAAGWTAALDSGQAGQMALAHARGIWAPGQEGLLEPYRGRYFAHALPAISGRRVSVAQRLARLLYPALLADQATIAATDAALADSELDGALRMVLLEQRAIVQQVIAARAG